jgi:hypothetical protein
MEKMIKASGQQRVQSQSGALNQKITKMKCFYTTDEDAHGIYFQHHLIILSILQKN